MKNTVFISGPCFEEEDLKELRELPFGTDTEFEQIRVLGLFEPDTVHVAFVILQGLGINAAYDLIKYTMLTIMKAVSEKERKKEKVRTSIVVEVSEQDEKGNIKNRRSVRISTSYKMKPDERENVAKKLTDDLLAGKGE